LRIILCSAPDGRAQTANSLADLSSVKYSCTFQNSWVECRFAEQAKVAGRALLVNVTGMRGVRLYTKPGDSNVAGGGTAERNDLTLSQAVTDCYEGREQWRAHSILFPNDYVDPPMSTDSTWNWAIVFDFHNTTPGAGQANFQINAMPATAIASDRATGLNFQVASGSQTKPTVYDAPIGPVVRNAWYNFAYHVKWSSGADGFITAWVNGVRKMDYSGPTLYAGQGCYLKLANNHSAFQNPSSVIHGRVLRGTTPGAVSPTPLRLSWSTMLWQATATWFERPACTRPVKTGDVPQIRVRTVRRQPFEVRVLAAKRLGIARRADGDPIIRQVGVTSLVSCDCGGVVHGCSGLTDR
jgi:hypothetical protein